MAKLHLVFGGELKDTTKTEFKDANNIDIIGIYPSYEQAQSAWRNASQRSVDNALVRYFIADLSALRETQ